MNKLTRRDFLKTAAGIAALLVLSHIGSFAQSKEPKMNVLFIAVDDLRPQLGSYGNEQVISTNIDKLASAGLLFERAYCQQAICSPSRISLLSGMRVETTKIYGLVNHFADKWPGIVSLPHHFKNNGYTTISIGKIYHHGNDDLKAWSKKPFRAQKGRGYYTRESKNIEKINKAENPNAGGKGPATEMADVPDNAYSDGKLADRAIEELQNIKDDPFFLAVGFRKPHLPFTAPKKYWDMYDPAELALASNPYPPKSATPFTMNNFGELRNYDQMPKGKKPVDDMTARHLIHGYHACVSYTDAQIGRILNELERQGLKKNTIVILWGDHGWKLGEHGSWTKHTNFEIDCNAPLIISDPRMKNKGIRTRALTEFVDIYPTLCELSGLSKPEHLEGISFAPLMKDPELSWKKAAFSIWVNKMYRYNFDTQIIGYAMKTDQYRYVEWKHTKSGEIKARELYDHQIDPQENVNVIDERRYAEIVKELEQMMVRGWKAALPGRSSVLSGGK